MENNKLRLRFVKDYNLPINVFDEEMFKYYTELYDFFPRERWESLKSMIGEKYGGNVEKWLEYCANVRDTAIESVIGSEKYKEFNERNPLFPMENRKSIGEHSCYNQEADGCNFVSIDLKKANFQAMKYMGVIDDKTYDDFIERNGGDDYIKGSKYLRQVIFGKMNPGRTVSVEKHIMNTVMSVSDEVLPMEFKLYSQNSDELVYKQWAGFYGEMKVICPVIEKVVSEKFGIDVRAEFVQIRKLPIVNVNGNNVDAYVRKNLITGEETLKKASTTFYPQIYKLWKGMEIEDRDLVFFFEDQLCRFNNPLIIKEQ